MNTYPIVERVVPVVFWIHGRQQDCYPFTPSSSHWTQSSVTQPLDKQYILHYNKIFKKIIELQIVYFRILDANMTSQFSSAPPSKMEFEEILGMMPQSTNNPTMTVNKDISSLTQPALTLQDKQEYVYYGFIVLYLPVQLPNAICISKYFIYQQSRFICLSLESMLKIERFTDIYN